MLEVRGLSKTFVSEGVFTGVKSRVKAVDGVSFELQKGKILALVGESGSGKTTIARCVAGLETPDSGELLFNGARLDLRDRETRRSVQYVFQDTLGSLNPRMKAIDAVSEPVKFHFGLKGGELREAALETLRMVGLTGDMCLKYPHELSGGQRQRVGIARALSMKPGLLIADEPVSSLDVSIQAQVLSLFQELNETRGISILFITHDLRIVKSLAHDIIVLKKGVVEERGSVEEVFASPKNDYTRLLLGSIPGKK